MSIKVRQPEPVCTLSLTREAWLNVLVHLTEFSDQAATDAIAKVVDEVMKQVRAIMLNKEKQEEYAIELHREQCLDLYVHLKESGRESGKVVDVLAGQLKEFLIGGANE